MRFTIILFMVVMFFNSVQPTIVLAQQDTTITEIIRLELKDGSVIVGEIIREDDSSLQMRTLSKIEMVVPKDQIRRREIVSGQIIEGELWRKDPNSTRLFFAPTGRALKAGQGYFSAYQIFFPFIAVGITDFFTLAGGVSLFPGVDSQLLYLAPKITPIQTEDFALSGGVLYIKIPNEGDGAGIVYGVGTFGSEKSAFTIGLGYGFSGDEFADNPILVLGGEIRGSRSIKIITENWIVLGGDTHLLSGGIRFFGENLAADFGLIMPTDFGDGFPFIPWLGFAYNFKSDK